MRRQLLLKILHSVRNNEFGVGLRKIVEHNKLAVVGAWP